MTDDDVVGRITVIELADAAESLRRAAAEIDNLGGELWLVGQYRREANRIDERIVLMFGYLLEPPTDVDAIEQPGDHRK